jgi:hypothetical protein
MPRNDSEMAVVEAGTASDSPSGSLSRMRCLEQIWNIAEIGVGGFPYRRHIAI